MLENVSETNLKILFLKTFAHFIIRNIAMKAVSWPDGFMKTLESRLSQEFSEMWHSLRDAKFKKTCLHAGLLSMTSFLL